MNRTVGNNVSANLAPTSKSFVGDTAGKTGMSKRAISCLLQIANNLIQGAKRIVQANNKTEDTVLKLSRLPYAASLPAAGSVQSMEQYQQERRAKILALHAADKTHCCKYGHYQVFQRGEGAPCGTAVTAPLKYPRG